MAARRKLALYRQDELGALTRALAPIKRPAREQLSLFAWVDPPRAGLPPVRAELPSALNSDELHALRDMLPFERLALNRQEVLEVAIAVIRQASEDLHAPPQSLEVPSHLTRPSQRSQWLRLARLRAKHIEEHRQDAERFLWSPWYDDLCAALDVDDPDELRAAIYDRKSPSS